MTALLLLCLAAKPLVLDVWPDGKPPGATEAKAGETSRVERKIIHLSDIRRPTLTIFRPDPKKDTGACVVVCPGGGYNILAWDLEGTEVAEWLNGLGVTAAVLKYRVPRPKDLKKGEQPVGPTQDAQRAVRLVRSRAKEWKIDPKRVGILGFSAGGHLAASVALKKPAYEAIDMADEQSARPDFAVLVYTAYLVNEKKDALLPEFVPTKDAPPMFLVHTKDDPVTVQSSILLHKALKDAGVEARLKVYDKGGHGYGLRPSKDAVSGWPKEAAAWLEERGWLKP
ncbi:MAG: alpha/beta hydrolase [Gemmataceae bacterium]|nr:alpha/beta hydrolase [Gemmataceae bacterium]